MQDPQLYRLPSVAEPFSAISHLVGAAAFVVLGVLLLQRGRGNSARMAFLGVYAASCVLLFSMSAFFHITARGGTPNLVAERLDHGAIFVLIAGSFTPVHGLLFRGALRWGALLLVWSAAAAGVTSKAVFFASLPEWLGLSFYMVLGWLGAISGLLLWRRYGFGIVVPLLLGGLAYSAGAAADFVRWPTLVPGVIHSHEVFHVMVLIGAGLHWWFVWRFADGRTAVVAGARGAGGQAARE